NRQWEETRYAQKSRDWSTRSYGIQQRSEDPADQIFCEKCRARRIRSRRFRLRFSHKALDDIAQSGRSAVFGLDDKAQARCGANHVHRLMAQGRAVRSAIFVLSLRETARRKHPLLHNAPFADGEQS